MSEFLPQRVVSLQPSATSILARLGVLDRVVACTKYCRDVCPEIAERKHMIVADSWSAQSAQILAAKPDLVLASVPYQLESVGEILKAGIPFLALAPHRLADVYADITKIAALMGVAERGHRLIAGMKEEIERVRACSAYLSLPERPRVFCEEWGKPIIHSQGWVAELVTACGGEFLGTPGAHTTADQVRTLCPDVVVAAWCGAGDRVPLEKIARERGWDNLPAVRHCRVYCVRDELLNTPGPALIDGLHALAHAINPRLWPSARGIRRIAQPE